MPYTKTTWVNNSQPSINATRLNNLESQYQAVLDEVQSGTGDIAAALNSTFAPVAFAASPSPVDARALVEPVPAPGSSIDSQVVVGRRRNLMEYTEDLSNVRYLGGNTLAVNTADQITLGGITLTRVTSSNFFGNLNTDFTGVGMAPFVTGRRYLLSMYVVSTDDVENFFFMRDRAGGSGNGYGRKFVQPGRMRRVWQLAQAVSTSGLRVIENPTVGFSATSGLGVKWVMQGEADGDALSMYVGGMQIEEVSSTALDGIAIIGDSTMQGASGSNDIGSAREVSAYLEGLLSATVFNRAVSGEQTGAMDARWATDITSIKPSCKYVIIQGGINDIANDRPIADIQASIASMVSKAKTDGFIPVLLTCTPTTSIAGTPARETARLALNAWLKATYPNVIDIAAVVEDPFDASKIRRTKGTSSAGWWGDGIHYSRPAKRAIAEAIAAWPGWELPTPTAYQKVAATTFTPLGQVVLVSPDGTRYALTVANGGALSTVAV